MEEKDKTFNKEKSKSKEGQESKLKIGAAVRRDDENSQCQFRMSDQSEDECSGGLSHCSERGGSLRERHFSTDSASGSEDDRNNRKDRADDSEKRQRVDTAMKGFIIPGLSASPPRFVSLEQIMKAANGVTNMALAHEIAVDRDFKLEKMQPPEKSLERQVKDIIHKAFWDAFESQLVEDPPNYSHAMILLNEIKEGLLSLLLPHHTKIKDQINETLDIDLIKQQAENNALDFNYYAQYIISIMAKLCAPVRDEKIRELMAITEIVAIYRGILQLMDLLKLDMANFTIQQMRPHIQQHSIEYEKQKFSEFLETQEDGLEFTRVWLKRTIDDLHLPKILPNNSNSSSDFETASSKQENRKSNNVIITKAYMSLLEWKDEWVFPETLVMDQGRFLDLRNKVHKTTLVASILLVTFSTGGQAIVGLSEFKEQLKQHVTIILNESDGKELADLLGNVSEQIMKEVNECLEKHGFSHLNENEMRNLKGQIESLVSPDCQVRKLVQQRLLEFVSAVLESTTASPIRIPPGLSSMQPELARITGQFLRLVSHNRAVFGDYYVDIIDAIKPDSPPPIANTESKLLATSAE